MKLVTIFFTFFAIYFYYSAWRALAVFEDKKTYEKMTFDLLLRGSWMLDHCARSLFNCYEIVKADVMCANFKYYSSACAIQRNYCHIQDGMRDDYGTYHLYEEYCLDTTYEWLTRRAARRLRLPLPLPPAHHPLPRRRRNNNTLVGNAVFITSKAS